jgi:DNA-binding transcriptional ArsR family regulator
MPVVPPAALEQVAHRFALLADPTRLRILSALHEAGTATVGQIASASRVSVANTSQHLGRLAVGGIVARRRQGRSVVYRISEPSIEELCSIVCASVMGDSAIPDPATSPIPPPPDTTPRAG